MAHSQAGPEEDHPEGWPELRGGPDPACFQQEAVRSRAAVDMAELVGHPGSPRREADHIQRHRVSGEHAMRVIRAVVDGVIRHMSLESGGLYVEVGRTI
jgi:hypothetical protein